MKRFLYLALLAIILIILSYEPAKGYSLWLDLRKDLNLNVVKTITVWDGFANKTILSDDEKEMFLKELKESRFSRFNNGSPVGPTPTEGIRINFYNGKDLNVNQWGPGTFEIGISGGKQLFVKNLQLSKTIESTLK